MLSRCCDFFVVEHGYFGRRALIRGPGLCGASMEGYGG